MQLSAYAKCLQEADYTGEIARFSVVFDSKIVGPPKVREWPADEALDDWLKFHALLQAWQTFHNWFKPEKEEKPVDKSNKKMRKPRKSKQQQPV